MYFCCLTSRPAACEPGDQAIDALHQTTRQEDDDQHEQKAERQVPAFTDEQSP
jgi:hypothetical protein